MQPSMEVARAFGLRVAARLSPAHTPYGDGNLTGEFLVTPVPKSKRKKPLDANRRVSFAEKLVVHEFQTDAEYFTPEEIAQGLHHGEQAGSCGNDLGQRLPKCGLAEDGGALASSLLSSSMAAGKAADMDVSRRGTLMDMPLEGEDRVQGEGAIKRARLSMSPSVAAGLKEPTYPARRFSFSPRVSPYRYMITR